MPVSRDSARILLTQVASAVFGAGYFLLLTRWFSTTDMAGLAVFGLVTGLAQIASQLGLGDTCIKRVPELRAAGREPEARTLMRTALTARLGAAVVAAVLVWLAAVPFARLFFKTDGYAAIIRVAAAGALAASVMEALQHLAWALQRFQIFSQVILITNIPVRLVALAGYAWGGITGYLGVVVLGQAGLAAWLARALGPDLKGGRTESPLRPDAVALKETILYSLPYYANAFGRYAGIQADQWLTGVFLPPRMLAMYYVIRRFADYLILFADALVYPLPTRLAQLKAQGFGEVGRAFRRAGRLSALVLIPACTVIAGLAWPLLRLYGSGRYIDGAPLLAGLSLVMMLYGPYGLYATGAYIMGTPMTRLAYESLNGGLHLLLGAALMPWFSLSGLVAARAVAMAGTIWFARRIFRRAFPPETAPPGIDLQIWRDLTLAGFFVAAVLFVGWLGPPHVVLVPLTTILAGGFGGRFLIRRLTENDLATIREAFPGTGNRLAEALGWIQTRLVGRKSHVTR